MAQRGWALSRATDEHLRRAIEGALDATPHDSWRATDAEPIKPRELANRIGRLEGMSQSRLARILGVTDRQVRRWCGGQTPVPPSLAVILSVLERELPVRPGAPRVPARLTEANGWYPMPEAAQLLKMPERTLFKRMVEGKYRSAVVPGRGARAYRYLVFLGRKRAKASEHRPAP